MVKRPAAQKRRKRSGQGSATPEQSARRRSGQVQSLARAISLLNALTDEDYGLSLSDLAQKVGLAPSTTHRLLTTLQEERFVRFDLERNVWLVGVQAFVVGNAFVRSRDLIALSRPHMRNLMENSGETVNLAVEDQGEAIYLGQVECRQMMRAIAKPGGRVALHCSGVGKALLSGLQDTEINKIVDRRGLSRFTDKTVDTPAKLRQALSIARQQGYAFDDEENAVGLRCVAAVIFDEFGRPLAGLSLSGPTARITDERVPLLGSLVVKAASDITKALGGAKPDYAKSLGG